jgi:hypothetical protein
MKVPPLIAGTCFILSAVLMICNQGYAQLSFGAQLRTRTERRDGQGTLTAKDADAAFFTSQRTRFTMAYTGYRFNLYSVVQDVRVWGQDASTINRTTLEGRNGFMVHEAWTEIMLLDTASSIDNFSLKIGRQEFVYDDSRLLGNLDWLQQARRHDAAVLKFSENRWQAHLGFAFNQNAEFTSGNIYNGTPVGGSYPAGTNAIGTMYKAMQFLYLNRKSKQGYCSFLFLKDDFNKFHLDTTAKILDKGVWSRLTTGFNYAGAASEKLSFFASSFIQGGKSKDGRRVAAWFTGVSATYKLSEKLNVSLGGDWLSGNDGTQPSDTDKRFDPLYGTPHKFWGYMDYFYVASPSGTAGLKDYYLKLKFKHSEKLTFSLDAHEFYAANTLHAEGEKKLNSRLGTELDFITLYSFTKDITMEAGYCAMLATDTMSSPRVKNVSNADNTGQWAYLMLTLKTDLLKPRQ